MEAGRKDIRLTVTPFVQFVSKGSDVEEGQEFLFGAEQIQSGGLTLSIRTDAETEKIPEKEETYFYSYDACDGRRSTGKAKAGCRISAGVRAGEYRELSIVFSVDGTGGQMTALQIIEEQKAYRRALEEQAGFSSDMAKCLAKSAAQYIARRESTGGDTILAGFPFFEDWGRNPCTIRWMRRFCSSTACGCTTEPRRIWDLQKRCIRSWSGSWNITGRGPVSASIWTMTD